MKEILYSFFSEIGQKLAVLILVGTTALTTGSAVSRLVANPTKANETRTELANEVPAIIDESGNQDGQSGFGVQGLKTNTTSPNIVPPRATTPIPTPKLTQKIIPIATVTPKITTTQPIINPSSLCIITLSGNTFDVTKLRVTHSGGDIFKCGTDMTSVYIGRHGTDMSRMAKYAYSGAAISNPTGTTGTTNPTGTPTTSGTTVKSEDREDEHENDNENQKDEEERERSDSENDSRYVNKDEDRSF